VRLKGRVVDCEGNVAFEALRCERTGSNLCVFSIGGVLDWARNKCATVIEGRSKLHSGALTLGFWLKSASSNQVCILVRLV